jgi:FixJ family two-component response regulator
MLQPSVSLVLAATHSFADRDAGTEATSMEEADLQGHVKDPAAVGPWRERGVRQMNLSSSFGAGGASSLAVLCEDGERVYASALAYLAAGRALMGEAGQEEPYELIFALEFHTAECELLSADLGRPKIGLQCCGHAQKPFSTSPQSLHPAFESGECAVTVRPTSPDDLTSAEQPIVFVIDDDESMRRALTNLFQSVSLRVEVFGSAPELLRSKLPDVASCLVLDVRLPGVSGLDFQLELAKANIHIPIVFMTGHGDIPMSVMAMKAGAVDFLSKPFRQQEMLDAVTVAIERDRKRREDEKIVSNAQALFETLPPREREVLSLVAAGLMNKQIAAEIGIAEITVNTAGTSRGKWVPGRWPIW